MILQSPLIARFMDRIWSQWPLPIGSEELFGASGIAAIASDAFLLCVMETTIIKNLAIEILLGRVRLELLRLAAAGAAVFGDADTIIEFFAALAQQCFIGEYIFDQTEEETRLATRLRESLVQKLENGDDVSALLLTAVAAYFPLHTLPLADTLLHKDFAEDVAGLLRLQVREPQEEARDRASIPALTTIEDRVSLEVMRQYEESPYPRWTTDWLTQFVADRAEGKTGAELRIAPSWRFWSRAAAPDNTQYGWLGFFPMRGYLRSTSAGSTWLTREGARVTSVCTMSNMRRRTF
jgi:hypothetical protein